MLLNGTLRKVAGVPSASSAYKMFPQAVFLWGLKCFLNPQSDNFFWGYHTHHQITLLSFFTATQYQLGWGFWYFLQNKCVRSNILKASELYIHPLFPTSCSSHPSCHNCPETQCSGTRATKAASFILTWTGQYISAPDSNILPWGSEKRGCFWLVSPYQAAEKLSADSRGHGAELPMTQLFCSGSSWSAGTVHASQAASPQAPGASSLIRALDQRQWQPCSQLMWAAWPLQLSLSYWNEQGFLCMSLLFLPASCSCEYRTP